MLPKNELTQKFGNSLGHFLWKEKLSMIKVLKKLINFSIENQF